MPPAERSARRARGSGAEAHSLLHGGSTFFLRARVDLRSIYSALTGVEGEAGNEATLCVQQTLIAAHAQPLTMPLTRCAAKPHALSEVQPYFTANQSFSAVARAGGVGREPILLLLGGAHNHRRARRVLAVRIEAVLAANARRAEAAPRRVRGVAVMGVGPDLQHTCGRRRCERSARETWRVMGNV
jgi:hypothetical protein